MKEYIRVTVLKKGIFGLDVLSEGDFRDWEIKETLKDRYFLTHGSDRTFITFEELRAGRKDVESNWSFPLGLHFGLEYIEKPGIWERIELWIMK